MRTELGDEKIHVLQIGIAGENLLRYTGITNDLRHFNGRNVMGAVMGSKNLRAVAVRDSQRYQTLAYDPETILSLGRKLAKGVRENPLSWDLQTTRYARNCRAAQQCRDSVNPQFPSRRLR
jgi:aldehyde:ferredoxin oxidoreductase